MSELDGLTAIPTDTKKVRTGQSARIPDHYDAVFNDCLDGSIDANSIAMRIRKINERRRTLTAKLDDPANADDPRRGDAEAVVFRLKCERDELIAQFVKLVTKIDRRSRDAGDRLPELCIDIAAFVHPSSLVYLVQRLKETRLLPFWVLVLVQDVDSANGKPPF